MKLIRENFNTVDILTENVNGQKSYFIEGIFLMAEKQNKNGRIYPMKMLEKEVARYQQEFIDHRRALGELGHPDTPTIILENVSHNIVQLKQEGHNFIGKAKILESTPKGKIAEALLKEGIPLGVSSRGVGSLVESRSGVHIVQDDFYLTTAADIVADPSAPKAFVKGILEEKEWVFESGLFTEKKITSIHSQMKKSKSFNEEHLLQSLQEMLKKF